MRTIFVSNVVNDIHKTNSCLGAPPGYELLDLCAVFLQWQPILAQSDYFGNAATSGAGNAGVALFHYHTGVFDNTVLLSPSTMLNIRYGFARWYQNRPSRSYGFDQSQIGMPRHRWAAIPDPGVSGGHRGRLQRHGGQYVPGERQRQP